MKSESILKDQRLSRRLADVLERASIRPLRAAGVVMICLDDLLAYCRKQGWLVTFIQEPRRADAAASRKGWAVEIYPAGHWYHARTLVRALALAVLDAAGAKMEGEGK